MSAPSKQVNRVVSPIDLTLDGAVRDLYKISYRDILKAANKEIPIQNITSEEQRRKLENLMKRTISEVTLMITYIGPGFYALFRKDKKIYKNIPIPYAYKVEGPSLQKNTVGVFWGEYFGIARPYTFDITGGSVRLLADYVNVFSKITQGESRGMRSWVPTTKGSAIAIIVSESFWHRDDSLVRANSRVRESVRRSLRFLDENVRELLESISIGDAILAITAALMAILSKTVSWALRALGLKETGEWVTRMAIAAGMAAWGVVDEDINVAAKLIAVELADLFYSGLLWVLFSVGGKIGSKIARRLRRTNKPTTEPPTEGKGAESPKVAPKKPSNLPDQRSIEPPVSSSPNTPSPRSIENKGSTNKAVTNRGLDRSGERRDADLERYQKDKKYRSKVDELLRTMRVPRAVPFRDSSAKLDPELVRLARDVRATQAGVSRQSFRQTNVATAKVRVDGEVLYLDAGNLRTGPHSEEWLYAQVTELRRRHRTVVVEQLYSERVPCHGTCGPLLSREYPNADIFFSTRRSGEGAASDLMYQYGVSSP